MKIKEIFKKDISRNINPAVVVSANEPEIIKAEIEEYVFTNNVLEHMYKFFNVVFNEKEKKTGVWVNGYYGSGKSHFIKYINYCIGKETSNNAFNHFQEAAKDYDNIASDITYSNIELLKNKVGRSNSDTIIFNIEAVSGDKGGVKQRFTRIFLNQFNRFRGYNAVNLELALYIEKQLDREGVFESFKTKIRDVFNKNWEEAGNDILTFKKVEVFRIIEELVTGIDIEYLDKKLKIPDEITIEDTLIPELTDYLKDKPENYRLIFLVDEISQYIGGSIELLLNLQTIVEKISDSCNNKVWIVCTAQQKLKDIFNETKSMSKETSEEAIGKILGRFETRIPLKSDEADYITKIRVLDKNSTGIETLDSIYDTNKDAIENQFDFQHSLYKGFSDKKDFVMSYPFIPYQFRLISDIFESFSQKGYVIKEVKDNERSVIGITHFTVKKNAEMEVGKFIPFDAFFNDLLEANLTHIATRIIERALKIDFVKKNTFAKRVVKILFMVSSLIESKAINFLSNRDNIASLLIENTDENRLSLQTKTQEVLDKLIKENIIRADEKGAYHFFKDDEIEVATLIQNTYPTEEDKLIFMNNILQKIMKVQNKFRYENKDFKISYWVDDKKFFPTGDIIVKVLVFDAREINNIAINNIDRELIICINNWFMKEGELKEDFLNACKTEKYLQVNSTTASRDRQKTHEIFRIRKNSIIDSIAKRIKEKFYETSFIFEKNIYDYGSISGDTPTKKYENMLHKYVDHLYKYISLQNNYAKNTEELRKVAEHKEVNEIALSDAEQYINDTISQFNDNLSLSDIIKKFEQAPFGWKDISVIHMVMELVKKRKREIVYNNARLDDVKTFVEKAIKSNERTSLIIKSQAECSVKLKDKAVDTFQHIFNLYLKNVNDCYKVEKEMKKIIDEKLREYEQLGREYVKFPFVKHFEELSKLLRELYEERDINVFFKEVGNSKEFVTTLSDECKQLNEFVTDNLFTYNEIRDFVNNNNVNFNDLEEDKEKAEMLKDFIENNDRPFDGFHKQKTVYKELKTALFELFEKHKKETIREYEDIYAELKVEADEKKVNIDEIYNINNKLEEINNKKRIIELKDIKYKSSSFKTGIKEEIIKKTIPTSSDNPVKTVRINIGTPTINNIEEMEKFLNGTRIKIKKELEEKKIVIIE